MYRHQTAVLVALFALWAGQARASDLPTALSLESEGRLGDALDAFNEALAQPGNSREDLTTIYLHLAVLRFGIEDHAGARQALHRLVALDRDTTLPGSAPPELQEVFDQVNEVWGDRRFDANVDAPEPAAPNEDASVRLSVIDDVAGLVDSAELVSDGDVIAEARGRGPSFTLTVPAATLDPDGATVTPRLLDEHGGIVWQGDAFEVSVSGQADSDDGVAHDEPSENRGRPGLRIAGFTLLGLGLAAVGAGAAMVAIDGRVIETRPVDGRPQERRYTTALGGWISIGVGGAGLVAAVVMIVLGYRDTEPEAMVLRVARGELVTW